MGGKKQQTTKKCEMTAKAAKSLLWDGKQLKRDIKYNNYRQMQNDNTEPLIDHIQMQSDCTGSYRPIICLRLSSQTR